MAISAYKRTITETESPRQIERRIMTRINSNLCRDQLAFDDATKQERLAILATSLRESLSENMRLWSALKIDLISPSNQMPADLRSSLISMAMFVERHTAEVLSGRALLRPLIDINQSIIGGLSGHAPEEL